MAKIGKEELIQMIKSQVEESIGSISDVQIKEIETAVEKKFLDMAKGLSERKITGTDNIDNIDESMRFKSLGDQLQAVYKAAVPNGAPDERLGLINKAASGANETVAAEGGFLVQPEFSNELYMAAHDSSVLYGKCRKVPIGANSNSLVLNALDEKSRANGSRWGGVQVYWSDEAGTVAATKPKFRQMTLKLKKLMGVAYATEELLQDSTALASVVSQAFSEEFGFKIDDGIVRGNGVGQMYGLLGSPAFVSVPKETNQAAATVVFENILNMWNRVPAKLRTKSEWYLNQDVEPQLFQMYLAAGTGGVPVYLPPNGIVNGPSSGSLMGRPVNPIEQCEALGTVGDIMLLALSEYLVVDKGAMKSAESIHVRFLYDEQAFRFTYRIDGQPLWNSTLTAYKGGTTRSPFVGVATRA
jgi:HK97 family phage major capsid protein